MSGEIETVLRLVAEGRLTPEEAAPIIEALSARSGSPRSAPPAPPAAPPPPGFVHGDRGRRVRIRVSEHGRKVVDVRVPLAFAAMAARIVPGIPDSYATLIEQAVTTDTIGPIVDAESEDGDGVLISVE
jgi:hypothetical protein